MLSLAHDGPEDQSLVYIIDFSEKNLTLIIQRKKRRIFFGCRFVSANHFLINLIFSSCVIKRGIYRVESKLTWFENICEMKKLIKLAFQMVLFNVNSDTHTHKTYTGIIKDDTNHEQINRSRSFVVFCAPSFFIFCSIHVEHMR